MNTRSANGVNDVSRKGNGLTIQNKLQKLMESGSIEIIDRISTLCSKLKVTESFFYVSFRSGVVFDHLLALYYNRSAPDPHLYSILRSQRTRLGAIITHIMLLTIIITIDQYVDWMIVSRIWCRQWIAYIKTIYCRAKRYKLCFQAKKTVNKYDNVNLSHNFLIVLL